MPRENRPAGDPRTRLYNSRAWQRTAAAVYARENETCQKCGAHPVRSAHHVPSLEAVIARGADPLDPDTCANLCKRCHGAADGVRAHTMSQTRPSERHPGLL